MEYNPIFDGLTRVVDADRCRDSVAGIHENDRWFDTPAFNRTAEYCYQKMREAGLAETEKLPLKADGKTAYGDWVVSRGWEAKSARLVLRPNGAAETVLADYREIPCSLVTNSGATPAGGVTAPVAVADTADALTGMELKGKIILTKLRPQEIAKAAAAAGALGIVTDCMPLYPGVRDTPDDVPDTHHWENGFQVLDSYGLFAFTLSPRKSKLLRGLLAQDAAGGLRLFAEADTRRYDAEVHVISGLLPGADAQAGEVLIYGHLYEPGAHDNASGCGLILELARALTDAVQKGVMPRPARGIRFVVGPECTGSMGYCAAHPDTAAKTVCGLVADMVGSEGKCGARMHIWHNPYANWSYADSLIDDLYDAYKIYSGERYDIEDIPFKIGTDNILADPCFGMSAPGLITYPARSYHSSMDTMDLIETDVLRRNCVVAGAYLYYLAGAGKKEALHLSALLERGLSAALKAAVDQDKTRRFLLRDAYARATLSLERLLAPKDAPEGWARVPLRTVSGCLTFEPLADRDTLPYQPAWNNKLNDLLFWSDGTRNLWQIAELSAASAKEPDIQRQWRLVTDFFALLEKYGYIEWGLSVFPGKTTASHGSPYRNNIAAREQATVC